MARKLAELAHCRAGDKGDTVILSLFPFRPDDYPLLVAQVTVERVRALPTPFVLTARAEGLLYGVGDLDEIIRRLRAFEDAGADVLYAPGLRTAEEIRTVVSAVTRPVRSRRCPCRRPPRCIANRRDSMRPRRHR